jgi:glycosyltransferase involved in cell wall biosynthesis
MYGEIAGGVVGSGFAGAFIAAYVTERKVVAKISQAFKPPDHKVNGRLVSVVIPTLLEEDYLPQLLETIRNQTYQPIEVIVADSSHSPSAEKTLNICQTYGAIYIYVPKLNLPHARNSGAREAQGEILVFIDADCLLTPTYIQEVVTALENGHFLAHGADPLAEGVLLSSASVILRSWLKPARYTTGRGIAIWKDAFWEIGGYNEDMDPTLGFREDLDLGKKVRQRYGRRAIKLLRTAYLGESARRIKYLGTAEWRSVRGVRGSKLIRL